MYRKTVQCYVFLLTLLDISLNNRLTAQGKSHDVTVQDSLIEGITFQEWGKESSGGGGSVESLRLSPPALAFGRAALACAHRLTVTLTNTANTTVHLASVAGTTPDFHASFFESKTLPPAGNTSFSVVYLGRREGPVAAHLYIHTSLGVHKYPVSAEGVASEWGVWPLVGLRVPLDASLEPLLELYNPTDQPVQVSEVYSSGGWVSLSLPEGAGGGEGGAGGAGGGAWRVPPRESRPIVRLRLRPPSAPADRPRPAYIRIKGDMVGGGAGGLVVAVEAVAAGAGAYIAPPQLRLRARGAADKPHTWELSAGNSGPGALELDGAVWGARCERRPPAADRAHDAHAAAQAKTKANGARAEGAEVRVLRAALAPHTPPVPALQLTLHYDRLWASYEGKSGAESSEGAWCAGWVVAGGAAMPYSVRLLPGTLALLPPDLDIVSGGGGAGAGAGAVVEREVRARNDFPTPLHLHSVHFGPLLSQHFECTSLLPLVLSSGQEAVVARLRAPAPPPLKDTITVTTNLTAYELPVTVHTGTLELEWEWPNSSDGTLRLGTVGAMSTRRVGLRLHNRGPRALCATALRARLPAAAAAALALAACAPPSPPDHHPCRCVGAGQWAQAWLTVVAPAAEGALEGGVWVGTPHATAHAPVALRVRAGAVHAPPLSLPPAAPWVSSWAPLVVDNSMGVGMRVLTVAPEGHDPAVEFECTSGEVAANWRGAVGRLRYAPERACRDHCYTGLQPDSPEEAAWWERGLAPDAHSLRRDEQHMRARRDLFARLPPAANLTLRLHTTEVVQIPVSGSVRAVWPALAVRGWAPAVAPVGDHLTATLTVRNPARTPLLVQPVLRAPVPPPEHLPEEMKSFLAGEEWTWSDEAFSLGEWSGEGAAGTAGGAGAGAGGAGGAGGALLLAPGASAHLAVKFAPAKAAPIATYLYLRNNLTIVEIIPIWGRGAHPSFELGGRRAGAASPLTLEVASCGAAARTLALRNTGPVPLRLREWRVAGRPCAARGFRLQPCAPAALPPNGTATLRLSFSPDYTLARAHAALTVRADAATVEFRLRAAAPARLLRACAREAPRPPFDPPLRAAGAALALAALAAVLAAAALDAERALRRARHARPPPAPPTRAPLDLRAAAHAPAPPAPPVRRRRAPRRPPPPDPRAPLAERRAFERWRAEVLRRADREDEHSSEDGAPTRTPPATPPEPDSPPRSSPSPERDDPDAEEDSARPSSDDNGRSGDSSVGSDSSPGDDLEGRDDSEPDAGPPPPRARPPRTPDPPDADADADAPPDRTDARREPRPRRDPGDPPRRTERRAPDGGEGRGRGPPARAHGRRDKGGRRRGGERAGSSPPLSPPAVAVEARAPAGVRWGASWSSVVAAGAGAGAGSGAAPNGSAPLPPIGSDVRRRAEERAPDQSLFYFNGEQQPAPAPAPPPDAFPWRADRPHYPQPVHDYLNDFDESSNLSAYGSVWAGGAWAWGGGLGVRPPPGFAPQPPPAPRAYDPFRSLAAIWAPGALDWRAPPGPAPGPAPPAPGPAPPAPGPAPPPEPRPDE